MSKPKVIDYIKSRYNMRGKSLGDIVQKQLESGGSASHTLFEILGFLLEYDEIE